MTPTPIAYDSFIKLLHSSQEVLVPANIFCVLVLFSILLFPALLLFVCDCCTTLIEDYRNRRERERELEAIKDLRAELEEERDKRV